MLADAPDASGGWQWQVTAAHRSLVERDASGARLLKESGPLGKLRVTVPVAWAPMGRLDFSASLAYARLDYDGRTQAGAPLATTTHHHEGEAGVRWRPMQPRGWGEAWLSLDALWLRRDIAATAVAAGLRETSTMWLPGIGWTGPQWRIAGITLAPHARLRAGIGHRLNIDYGGLFDTSSFHAGRRDEVTVGAAAELASGWSLSLDWQHASQRASSAVPIYRSGVVAGTVYQPRIAIDDVALTVVKRF